VDAVGAEKLVVTDQLLAELAESPLAFDSELRQGVVADVISVSGVLGRDNDCVFLRTESGRVALVWSPAKFRWDPATESVQFGWFANDPDVRQSHAVGSRVGLSSRPVDVENLDFLVENDCDADLEWQLVGGIFDG